MDMQENIEQSRRVFDQILHDSAYSQLLADADHLAGLIGLMDLQNGKHYLDLATGNGYIAFELAQRFPQIWVTGLDITPNTIHLNRIQQQKPGLERLDFQLFDGIHYPFADGMFYGIISRYAFHHFPDPDASLLEFRRILNSGGFVVISDPSTYDDDNDPFIDDFQRLRPDGHIHFYKSRELIALFQRHGFKAEDSFVSRISYPHNLTPDHVLLLEHTPVSVRQKYQVDIRDQQVFVTVQVMNTRFAL